MRILGFNYGGSYKVPFSFISLTACDDFCYIGVSSLFLCSPMILSKAASSITALTKLREITNITHENRFSLAHKLLFYFFPQGLWYVCSGGSRTLLSLVFESAPYKCSYESFRIGRRVCHYKVFTTSFRPQCVDRFCMCPCVLQ